MATNPSVDLARIDRLRTSMNRWLPSVTDAVAELRESYGDGPANEQVGEQVRCMRETLWLCDAATVMATMSVASAEREVQALRIALVEMANILGQSKAAGEMLQRLGAKGAINGPSRIVADLFLADVDRLIGKIGEWFGPRPSSEATLGN